MTNRYDSTNPLIGFSRPLAHVFPDLWRWPSEFTGIWRGYPLYVNHIQSGGAQSGNWSTTGSIASALWGGVIPTRQIAALQTADTLPTSRYFAALVAADLNGDLRPEIILGNLLSNQLEVYSANRQPVAGWPQAVDGGIRAAATVSDIDGDGSPEVLVGAADGKLYAWHANGTAVTGWP